MDGCLSNLNCPQYVDFMAESKGLQASPAYTTDKENENPKSDCEFEDMDGEDEDSYSRNSEFLPEVLPESCLSEEDSVHSASQVSCKAGDFPVNRPKNLLPECVPKKNNKANKAHKAQEFHFMEGLKRKREDEHIPLAEQVVAFYKKTPERFHTTGSKTFEPMEHWSPPVINPKTPNLRALKRMRVVNVLSRKEQEEKEIEEIKGYRFRARPLHQSILQERKKAKVKSKTPTKPQDFHLRTAERAAEIHARKKVEEKPYEFHARPVPKAILNGPTGMKEKLSLPVTEPKTPNFALKSRSEKWKSENKLNSTNLESHTFKALPVPDLSAPFVPKHEKKHTEIQPFSFDSKDKERFAKKEQKIMKEIEKEKEVFVFKAQGMPSPTPAPLPAVAKKPPTLPKPFNFNLDGKSSKHSSFNSSLDQTCPVFKAHPATVLEKPPFIPEKPAKQPVEVKEFTLHTDIRALERQKLKEIYDEKEREKELLKEQLRRIQEEEERQEIARLRKEAVHKANPVKHYKPVEVKRSDKPLTVPVSPKFKTDERLSIKH